MSTYFASTSAVATFSPAMIEYMIKNHAFLQKSQKVYNEIQLLGLNTIREREEEYVRRMSIDNQENMCIPVMKGPVMRFMEESDNESESESSKSSESFSSISSIRSYHSSHVLHSFVGRFKKLGASEV